MKRARLLCDLAFLRRCRNKQLLPTFCKVKFHTRSDKISNILKKTSFALLRESIQRTLRKLNNTERGIYELHLQLAKLIHPLIWQQIDALATQKAEREASTRTDKQKQKYERLEKKQEQHCNERLQNVVHNLSSQTLDLHSINVLKKGFNYAIAPHRIPIEDIICGVESAIHGLDKNAAETVRQDVSHILRHTKPPKSNISREEFAAIKHLQQDESIIALPADKGNATVVLNTVDYHHKMEALLQDRAYKPIVTDPTTYLEKTTKAKINSTPLHEDIKKKIIPREKSSRCPKIYGLPKIHKERVPLRPIVSSIESPTQSLAKYLAGELQSRAEQMKSYVKNADHFIDILKHQRINQTDILVSFDVVSLFTQIPVEDAVNILRNKHNLPEHFINLTKHCLDNTYFIYNGQRYRQIEGAPMGSPLSPIIANIFMEEFEVQALSGFQDKPKLWLRYVDDTFVIWPHGKDKLNEFLSYLNNRHPKIQFTMEIEEQNQLPFLDVLVIKNRDGTLGHTVYRKQTHTNRYLNAHSHHHPAQLNSVVKTLITRSQRLTDNKHRKHETETVKSALLANGYSLATINRAMKSKSSASTDSEESNNKKAHLPYIRGTTDRISRVLQKHNIDTIFTPHQKLGHILSKAKDRIPLEDQGVYEIPCRNCHQTYVGQTNRRIEVRREEHKLAVSNKQQTSSLAQHTLMTGHKIDFEKTKTIARCNNLLARITREAIEIEKRPDSMNKRDDAQRLSKTWTPTLDKLQIKKPAIEITTQINATSPHTHRTQNSDTGPVTRSRARLQATPTPHIRDAPAQPQLTLPSTRSRRR